MTVQEELEMDMWAALRRYVHAIARFHAWGMAGEA
jgi:hypothetical protein